MRARGLDRIYGDAIRKFNLSSDCETFERKCERVKKEGDIVPKHFIRGRALRLEGKYSLQKKKKEMIFSVSALSGMSRSERISK